MIMVTFTEHWIDSLILCLFLKEFPDLRYCRTKLFFYFHMFANPGRKLIDNAGTGISAAGINYFIYCFAAKLTFSSCVNLNNLQ